MRRRPILTHPGPGGREERPHGKVAEVLHAVWLALLLVSLVAIAATAVAATAAPSHAVGG